MRVRWIYGVIPVFIVESRDLQKGSGGTTNGLLIRMHPDYINSEPHIQHELEHARQNVRHSLTPWMRDHELEDEIDAYRVMLRYYPLDQRDRLVREFAAALSSPLYITTPITYEQARMRLSA